MDVGWVEIMLTQTVFRIIESRGFYRVSDNDAFNYKDGELERMLIIFIY